MKSLITLIKLQKTRVDEQKIVLAKLQEHLQSIENSIKEAKALEAAQKKLLHEKPDMGLTYGAFLKNHVKRLEALEKERTTAALAVELALDKLAELFEEQKRYEIAKRQREEEEARQEAAQETKTLDEIGSVGFFRRKG